MAYRDYPIQISDSNPEDFSLSDVKNYNRYQEMMLFEAEESEKLLADLKTMEKDLEEIKKEVDSFLKSVEPKTRRKI